jgi:two-component system, OmpR family, sensor kinase
MGRLFWKCFFAFILASTSGIGSVFIILHMLGWAPPASERPPAIVPVSVGVLVSLLFSALLAGYLTRPIRNLRDALAAFGSGLLATRIAPNSLQRQDEITDLGHDFNRMAQQIESLMGAQQRLLHDVSHELRSPLARLQAAVGLVRQAPAVTEPMLERIEREAERLNNLVGELLTLARLESGAGAPQRERVDLIDLLIAITDDARFEAQASGRELLLTHDAHFVVEVGAELISRAFENVIRNAVKFTAPGSTVEVSALREAGCLRVQVADRGPGVKEDELQQIFEPFERAQSAQGVPGVGLGLAIARRALQVHGGSITAQNRQGGGLVFTLTVPEEKIKTNFSH